MQSQKDFRTAIDTVEPLIKDPLRKGHCMLSLSIGDTVWSPKKLTTIPYSFSIH